MAEKTYRFLLRMPDHLRGRLTASAEQKGNSLNAELVERLTASLEQEEGTSRALSHARRNGALFRYSEGRGMSPKHLRLGLGLVALLGLLTAAFVAAAVTGGAGSDLAARDQLQLAAGRAEGKTPPLLRKKQRLGALTQTAVGSRNEGSADSSWGAERWIQDAYPATDIPAASLIGARKDWQAMQARSGGPTNAGAGLWSRLGPTNALYPFNDFRDRSVYVGGINYSAGGRITDVLIDKTCTTFKCRMWVTNATGGVYRTNNALAANPTWTFLSGTFETQTTNSIARDPRDPSGNTIWVGTGEFNMCGSGCVAGLGVYKSTDGGDSWTGPLGTDVFRFRGASTIDISPNGTVYVGTGRAILGISESCCGGVQSIIPGAPKWGLYRSLNGGQSWEFVHNGTTDPSQCVGDLTEALNGRPCSPRGVRRVMVDPNDPNTVYANAVGRGIWRSKSNGAPSSWERIMAPVGPASTERDEFDIVARPGAVTRMYVAAGVDPGSRVRRNDNVLTPAAATVAGAWIDLSGPDVTDPPRFSSWGYCDGQCSYDIRMTAVDDASDNKVYVSGSNRYSENNWVTGRSSGRAVLYSENADQAPGVVYFTDMTEDTTDQIHPNAIHPDHHALAFNPNNPRQFFDVGDGGVMRSNGVMVNDNGDCVNPKQYTGVNLTFCQLVLSRVPQVLKDINRGMNTLQPYNVAYNPTNTQNLSIGTQDNGTFETLGDRETWIETNVADGGAPAFDIFDPNLTHSSYQTGASQVSYSHLDQVDQNWTADTFFYPPGVRPDCCYGDEGREFITEVIADPRVSQRLFTGLEHVFRSNSFGSHLSIAKHRQHCNSWYGDADVDEDGVFSLNDICDDWKPLGNPGVAGRLTCTDVNPNAPGAPPANFAAACPYGSDRAGGVVAQAERSKANTATLWAATSRGRVFISKNVNNPVHGAVTFRRIDTTASNDPNRYITSIYADPSNSNHAYITYAGFNTNDAIAGGAGTRDTDNPGHVFEVFYNPSTQTATWTLLDGTGWGAFGDIPATDITKDEATGNLYVATDFGVAERIVPSGDWIVATPGLPSYPISDLEAIQSERRIIVAAFGGGVFNLQMN
ncbi:MAG: Arc family DNA-binding protein [Gaiellaceae bacterium]